MVMNLKVGSKVTLTGYPSKENDKYNPKEMEGTVVNLNGKYNPIEVVWENGIKNAYTEKHLELV